MRWLVLIILVAAPVAAALAGEVTARRTLRVGTIITAADLSGAGGADERRMVGFRGLEVRRAIYAGQPVRLGDLGPPTLVRRNEVVVMTYRAGALGLRTEGRALAPAGEGEVVDVMNLASRQTVRAVVTGRRQVEVRR